MCCLVAGWFACAACLLVVVVCICFGFAVDFRFNNVGNFISLAMNGFAYLLVFDVILVLDGRWSVCCFVVVLLNLFVYLFMVGV